MYNPAYCVSCLKANPDGRVIHKKTKQTFPLCAECAKLERYNTELFTFYTGGDANGSHPGML